MVRPGCRTYRSPTEEAAVLPMNCAPTERRAVRDPELRKTDGRAGSIDTGNTSCTSAVEKPLDLGRERMLGQILNAMSGVDAHAPEQRLSPSEARGTIPANAPRAGRSAVAGGPRRERRLPMTVNEDASATLFCLFGTVDGQYCSFPLTDGRHQLGSDRSSTIRLRERGISRRHAELEVNGDHLVIQDAGSKNGTLVNGRPVSSRQGLQVGDELRFGPVTLVLGRIEAEDSELGLSLGSDAGDPTTTALRLNETTLLTRAAPAAEGLDWVEAFWRRLTRRRTGDLQAVLELLVRASESTSGCWVEWARPGDGPTILAAFGELGPLPPEPQLRRRADRPGELVDEASGDRTAVALRTAGGELFAIALWGRGSARRAALRPLLRLAVLLAEPFRNEPTASDAPISAPEPDSELRWPEGILVGTAPTMARLYEEMRPLVRADLPVLISGETGVGKEHLARTLHLSCDRRHRPFVAVNCAAIPAELLEAELFGIARGVATGVEARKGKFSEADGGTLFLDEIGDMPAGLQVKLLRALQDKEVQPLGAAPIAIDVRIVAATNSHLLEQIEQGSFRRDLYYRLAGFVLQVPPLRERIEDLPALIAHFLRRQSADSGKNIRGLTVKALRLMTRHAWPGNVRELEHEVRRLAYVCPDGRPIDSGMLSRHIGQAPETDTAADFELDLETKSLDQYLEATERRVVSAALTRTGGNQSQAAKLLGISRNGLSKRLQRMAIDAREFTAHEREGQLEDSSEPSSQARASSNKGA